MNVALTRCRKGMVVVTNKCFLSGAGRNTLLGKLCYAWSQRRDAWIDWKAMLNDSVALPGLPVWSYGTLSPAAPVLTPASASQRLLVYTQSHEQMGPDLHTVTVTPRLDAPPLPRTTMTATTYNMFPSLSSMAQSRPTEARQPLQLGASQFPKCDPVSYFVQSQLLTRSAKRYPTDSCSCSINNRCRNSSPHNGSRSRNNSRNSSPHNRSRSRNNSRNNSSSSLRNINSSRKRRNRNPLLPQQRW